MTSTLIIEESENCKLERMAIVKTRRGDEYIVNVDQVVCAIADLFSDLANEQRLGWNLNPAWYQQRVNNLRAYAVLAITTPDFGGAA